MIQNSCGEFGLKSAVIDCPRHFDPIKTFDCGQCFRFNVSSDGSVSGVIGKRFVTIEKRDDKLYISGVNQSEAEKEIVPYLGLDEDYDEINRDIEEHFGVYNDTIYEAERISDGIRILRQEKWETLVSFIISQNNNIGRIKKIVERICEKFGEPFVQDGKTYYSFPTPEALKKAGKENIFSCGTGFRDKYIVDCAEKVCSGEIDLDKVSKQNTEEAMQTLCTIKGVGPKVASCALLFGFHRTESFPIDVWIKRVLEKYYSDGIDLNNIGNYGGIAQQYLFYYERYQNGGSN